MQRFWAKVDKTIISDCWLWTGAKASYGHGRFTVHTKIVVRSHRFIWEILHGVIPEGMVICHKCDNTACVNPEHLFMGTQADNIRDMHLKKREIRGSKCPWAKLTKEQSLDIKNDTRPQRKIAKEYGICQQSVSLIKQGKNWKIFV